MRISSFFLEQTCGNTIGVTNNIVASNRNSQFYNQISTTPESPSIRFNSGAGCNWIFNGNCSEQINGSEYIKDIAIVVKTKFVQNKFFDTSKRTNFLTSERSLQTSLSPTRVPRASFKPTSNFLTSSDNLDSTNTTQGPTTNLTRKYLTLRKAQKDWRWCENLVKQEIEPALTDIELNARKIVSSVKTGQKELAAALKLKEVVNDFGDKVNGWTEKVADLEKTIEGIQ